jgi:hypothetical protein
MTTVDITIGLWDRLRVLWHGKLSVSCGALLENPTGKTKSLQSVVHVPMVFPRRASEAWVAPQEPADVHQRIGQAMEKRK